MGGAELPSWRPGAARDAILAFLDQVTDPASAGFVPEERRIATFDNDGTLWVEKPQLTELLFIKDMLRDKLARDMPWHADIRWRLLRWLTGLADRVLDDALFLVGELLKGTSTAEYRRWVMEWLATARHPRYECAYTELTYAPMRELLALFAARGFRNYLVSGGTSYFIRPWCEGSYGIPPEQVIGSRVVTRLHDRHGKLDVVLEPIPWYLDNGPGKVLAIEGQIALQPIAAFGNSSGDIAMLRWAGAAATSLCMLIHHTDGEREYCYSPGKKTLKAAQEHGWQVVDMKQDWERIFTF
ncbi:MAG: haloacid dehalogenase-like hydrolase [Gammaproteobacteria bacterium]|nr:haloacid dehalogenase-like hydrolase [Gammaproteobacteria bacterium]